MIPTVSGILVGVAAVIVSLLSVVAAHRVQQWQRRTYSLSLSIQWDTLTLTARSQFLRRWKIYDWALPGPVPFSEIAAAYEKETSAADEDPRPRSDIFITEHITSLLNFMNTACLAVERRAADEDIVRDDLGQPFMRWTEALEGFLRDFAGKEKRPEDPWPALARCLLRWYPERAGAVFFPHRRGPQPSS